MGAVTPSTAPEEKQSKRSVKYPMSFRWITTVTLSRQTNTQMPVGCRLLGPEDEGRTILRNVGENLPVYTAWHQCDLNLQQRSFQSLRSGNRELFIRLRNWLILMQQDAFVTSTKSHLTKKVGSRLRLLCRDVWFKCPSKHRSSWLRNFLRFPWDFSLNFQNNTSNSATVASYHIFLI